MGASKCAQTTIATSNDGSSSSGENHGPPPQQNLGKGELGAVIFGCTNATMSECLSENLFGLPGQHFRYVNHIEAGMPLFLFNFVGCLLHGIFEAASDGALNINPNAWQSDKTARTQFPAQVKFLIQQKCSPLVEAVFEEAISDNYFTATHFMFELTHTQKDHLLSLFLQNMQTPLTKAPPPASKFTSNLVKLGTQKSLQKPTEVDNSGPKPLTTNISDKLQNMAPPKFDRGIVTAEEELDKKQWSSPENEMASNNGFDKHSQRMGFGYNRF